MTDHLQVHLSGDLAERVREHVPPGDRTAWIALALEDALDGASEQIPELTAAIDALDAALRRLDEVRRG